MIEYRVRHVSEYRDDRASHYSYEVYKRRQVDARKLKEMIELYKSGMCRTHIARHLYVSVGTVTKHLKAAGLKIQERQFGHSEYYPFDGKRYRVAKFCNRYALIDKKSPKYSRPPKLWVEEIIDDSEGICDLIAKAKELEKNL